MFEFLDSAGAAGPEWTRGMNNELTSLDLVTCWFERNLEPGMGCLSRFSGDLFDAGSGRCTHSNKLLGLGVILTREAVVRGELKGHSHKPGVKLVHTEQTLAHSLWLYACHLDHREAGEALKDLSPVDDGSPEV